METGPRFKVSSERLFDNCGITHLDLNLLLDAKQDDELKDWRDYILTELENFVVGTGWFTTRRDVPVGVPLDLSTPTGMSCIGTYGENCKSDNVSKYRVL